MELAVGHQLGSENPVSKPWCTLCRFASVPGAFYNRGAFRGNAAPLHGKQTPNVSTINSDISAIVKVVLNVQD